MAQERLFADVIKELRDAKKTGALYVSITETSEDLFRIYFKDGEIYHIRYGTAIGKDCLDILEYYTLGSANYFNSITAPEGPQSKDLPDTPSIIDIVKRTNKKVRVRS